MQDTGAALVEFGLQAGPDGGVGAGELEGVDGPSDVQTGTADEDGGAAGGEQPVDLGAGEALVLGDAGGLGHVPDVEEMVRNAAAFLLRQFGGPDVHPPVELHRVCVDDLAPELLGQEYTQIGLSGRCGADNGDDPRGGSCASHRPSLANLPARPRMSYVTGLIRLRCLLRGSGRRSPRNPSHPSTLWSEYGRFCSVSP